MKRILTIMLLALVVAISGVAQEKKKLTVEDYDQWQRLGTATMSENGEWISYGISPMDGDGWMVLRSLANAKEDTFKLATTAKFSDDNKWFAFRIGHSEKETEKSKKAKTTLKAQMGLMNLVTSEVDTFKGVSGFEFAESGTFIAMSKYPAKGTKSSGKDLILHNLKSNSDQIFGNVSAFEFNEGASKLAMIIDAEEKFGNGAHLVDLNSMSISVLESDETKFRQLTWNEEGDALAFLKAEENIDYENENHEIFVFTNLNKKSSKKSVFNVDETEGFPEGNRISESRKIRWSDDSKRIFFGLKEWKKKEEKEDKDGKKDQLSKENDADETENKEDKKPAKKKDDDLPPAGVDVWHWKDQNIMPRQKVTSGIDKNFTYQAVWHLDSNNFVQIGSGDIKTTLLTGDQNHAYGYDQKPYEPNFEEAWRDVYVIDVATGDKVKILEKSLTVSASPGGKYIIYFKDKNWWTYNISTKQHVNITTSVDTRFENFTRIDGKKDHPPFGRGAWFEKDEAVIIYDQYDAYRVKPDGSGVTNLTDDAESKIRYRVVRLDTEEDYLKKNEILYFSAYGDWTKKSGYYFMEKGKKLEEIIFEDQSIGRLKKAKESDTFLLQKQRADDSPDYFVFSAGTSLVQVTNTNPQQSDYHWAGTELITYTNGRGEEMQGKLLYPADYQPGKKYPMVVYIYELRSQSLHSYDLPLKTRAYSQRGFSSEGYFVYEPDITYEINEPGNSAVECVVPAVKEVLKRGMVNEDQVGLMGHSWGAYQTAFIVTQTDIFSAAVAGAPLIDMISMSLLNYENSGNTNLGIFETSQGRLEEPFWEMPEKYMDNSPLFHSEKIKTPLLVAFGNKDGAVNWYQGVEMYNTMRRREKPFVLLVYDGENHGLRKKENQIDYFNRTHAWMRHYLLGEEPADWIEHGVPFLEKKTKK